MCSNHLWDFELYCIILIQCQIFLREDEIGRTGCHTINSDVSIIKSNDCVEGIAFEIQGKADATLGTLMMWFDHDLPEFCPICHLLAFLRMTRNKDGYFFLDYNYLISTIMKDQYWDGTCTEAITYSDVLAAWKNLCSATLEREGKLGAHSGRKMAYLFGVWGSGQDTDLMLSMRHKQ